MMSARLLPKLLVVSLMILSVQSLAQAQDRFFGPVFDRDRPSNNFNRDRVVLNENLYRDFRGQSQIDLKQVFRDPNRQFKGMSVESISMVASSSRGRAQAALEINGLSQPADRQTVPPYARQMNFRVDPQRNVIGRDINSLKIQMRGNVFVESVEIVLKRNSRGGRNEIFEQQVSDFINFEKTYKLRQTLGIGQRHNGKKVQFVEVTGTSPSGNARAQLLIEGRPVGQPQYFSRFQGALRFQLPFGQDVLGDDIRGLQIRVSGGGAHVTNLKVAVQSRRGGGGPGRTPQVVERNIDLHVTGHQSHSLSALLARRDLERMRVKTVEVTGRSRAGNGQVQLCEQAGRWGQNNCQRGQTLNRSLTRHSFFSGESLGDIELRTRGQIHIQKIVVTFERF